jgi:hypothetical protein
LSSVLCGEMILIVFFSTRHSSVGILGWEVVS